MTAPDELERVWRVVEAIPAINDIAEAILSERAELLATVERMRHELVRAGMHIEAALTTGEANHKDKP